MGAFRRGLIIGMGIGYVQGAKAGRERYEQINRSWKKVKATPGYQRLSEKANALIGLGIERGKLIALDTLGKATDKARTRSRAGGNGYDAGPT